jgi:type I restriction enzyme R subunit
MNTRFDKFLKTLEQEDADGEHIQKLLGELHKSFASLSQEDQKYANIFIHDVQSGDAIFDSKKTFREHITEYQSKAKNSEIDTLAQVFGLDDTKLKNMLNSGITKLNINEYGRFDELKNSVDKEKAKAYFEQEEGKTVSIFQVNIKVHKLFQDFIISGGFDLKDASR